MINDLWITGTPFCVGIYDTEVLEADPLKRCQVSNGSMAMGVFKGQCGERSTLAENCFLQMIWSPKIDISIACKWRSYKCGVRSSLTSAEIICRGMSGDNSVKSGNCIVIVVIRPSCVEAYKKAHRKRHGNIIRIMYACIRYAQALDEF